MLFSHKKKSYVVFCLQKKKLQLELYFIVLIIPSVYFSLSLSFSFLEIHYYLFARDKNPETKMNVGFLDDKKEREANLVNEKLKL